MERGFPPPSPPWTDASLVHHTRHAPQALNCSAKPHSTNLTSSPQSATGTLGSREILGTLFETLGTPASQTLPANFEYRFKPVFSARRPLTVPHTLPASHRLIREDTELLLGLSPETKLLVELDPRAVAQVPEAVRQTPNRLRSLDAYEDVTLSPGELGGSQYIMSPGHELASSLQRSESTMSDGRTTVPSVEEVAAAAETHQNTTQNSRLFPIFVKGRKVVHLVRHGQSTYNEAISGPGSWDEPNIFDAPLTKLGVSQAKALGSFLSKLPKDAVWVTSPLTRAMETCVYGYKSSLEVTSAQRRKGAAMSEAAGGGGKAEGVGKPPVPGKSEGRRGKSRLSHGGKPGCSGRGAETNPRESDENGYCESDPMLAGATPAHHSLEAAKPPVVSGCIDLLRGESSRFSETNGGGACDERTPAPTTTLRRLGSDVCELGVDAVGASPSETIDFDASAAEMSGWGDQVIVHPFLSEKLATSGDIGRCKGKLIHEFPLLGLGLSRLPGDVWWYNKVHQPNDAERELFQSHEPSNKFKERVATFRHWLMSRADKTFVVFGHSTFFKELVGGNRSLRNCEVHTYHL